MLEGIMGLSNLFAQLFMIPFSYCCKFIKLPEQQYRLIEDLIFHWVNREYDYELFYDVDVGVRDREEEEPDVRMSIEKCYYCERICSGMKGHAGWCPESVNPEFGKH